MNSSDQPKNHHKRRRVRLYRRTRSPIVKTKRPRNFYRSMLAIIHTWYTSSICWLKTNTFAKPLFRQHAMYPLFPYLLVIFLQVIATVITYICMRAMPVFHFSGGTFLLVTLLVALGWGVGPSIFAILVGILFQLIFLPHFLSLSLSNREKIGGIALYLASGMTISILTSRAQRARRQANDRACQLEVIFRSMADAVMVYDLQGRVIQENPAAHCLLAQVGPAGAEQQSMWERHTSIPFFTEDGIPLPREQVPMARILRGESFTGDQNIVFFCYTRDKQLRWFSVSGAPLYDAQGHMTGGVSITRDVTERQKLIQHLQNAKNKATEQARQLDTIFEAITDGVLILDSCGEMVHMNTACREMLAIPQKKSYKPQGELPFEVLDEQGHILPLEQWPQTRMFMGESITGATAVDVQLKTLEERIHQVSVTGAPIRNVHGEITSIVLVCRDVTERRALEQRTRKSLETLLQMAQAMVEEPHIFLSDSQQLNHAEATTRQLAQRLAELTREVLGYHCLSLIGIEPETEKLKPLAVTGLSPEQECSWWIKYEELGKLTNHNMPELVELLRYDQMFTLDITQTEWYEPQLYTDSSIVLIVPLNLKEQLLGLLILDYEGHPINDGETVLIHAMAQFIALVLERERLLTERAEAQANVLALQETNRLLDEFIGIASHELRTPITAMLVNIQLAQRQVQRLLHEQDATKEQQRLQLLLEILKQVDNQINRQNNLVDDMLDAARIRSNKIELHLELCDITELIRETVAEHRSLQPDRTIHLDVTLAAEAHVLADANRVRQVLHNYLSNALKYSEAEKPVEVFVERTEDSTSVYVAVRDYGPGLSAEEQTHLWERFYRVPTITVRSGSGVGLGLGLHISKIMIEQQGGQVGVRSTPGQGSTFWFTLPLAASETPE